MATGTAHICCGLMTVLPRARVKWSLSYYLIYIYIWFIARGFYFIFYFGAHTHHDVIICARPYSLRAYDMRFSDVYMCVYIYTFYVVFFKVYK